MADRTIKHEISLQGIDMSALSTNTSSELSSRIDKLASQLDSLAKAVQSQSKSSEDLSKSIPAMSMAILKASSDLHAATSMSSPEERDKGYYERKALRASSKFDVVSSGWDMANLSSDKESLLKHRNTIRDNIDANGKLINSSKEVKSSIESLSAGLSQLGKSAKSNSTAFNSFNASELVIAAALGTGSRYYGLQAAYDVNLAATPASQLGQLTVSKDIAQRNAITSGITTAASVLPLAGTALGPLGTLAGFGAQAAVSIPAQIISNTLNAREQQKLQMQQLANQVTLGGVQGGPGQVNPPPSIFDKLVYSFMNQLDPNYKSNAKSSDYGLGYSVSNAQIAKYINSGQGNAATTYASVAPSLSLYNATGNINSLATSIASIAEQSGVDLSSIANPLTYLTAVSGGGVSLNKALISSFGGISNLSSALGNAANITQLSAYSPQQALAQQGALAPYGQNVMNAGANLATMASVQKLQTGLLLSAFAPGVTLKQFENNPALASKVLSGGSNIAAGIPALQGEDVNMNQVLFQSVIGASNEQAYQYAKTGTSEPAHNTQSSTPNQPDAVGKALNELSKTIGSLKSTPNAVQSVTLNATNVTLTNAIQGLNGKLNAAMSQLHNTVSGG